MNKCCFCGRKIIEGFNPSPLEHTSDCCIDCNVNLVLPVKLYVKRYQEKIKEIRDKNKKFDIL